MSGHVAPMIKNSKNSEKSNILLRQKWNSPNNTLQQYAHHKMLKFSCDLYKGVTQHFQRNITQKY